MKFDYIDIHSHLNLKPLKGMQDEVIKKLEEENIATITVGVDFGTSQEAVRLAGESKHLFASVGLHPADNATEVFDFEKYRRLAESSDRVVAIGECGLDYFRLNKENASQKKDEQEKTFRQHIELALALDVPLMLHIRPKAGSMDAYEDAIEILKGYKLSHGDKLRGNSHFFAGTPAIARQLFDLGFTISFTGVVTFSDDYNQLITEAPLDMIHIETDAPFVAPVPYRGKTAEPWMVVEVAQQLAEIRGEESETIQEQLRANAKKLFDIG